MWRIGVDVGGTKIEAILLTPEGEERGRLRIPSPRGSYPATLDALESLIAAIRGRNGIGEDYAAGFGIPGSLSPATGLVRNANSVWLNGENLKADLEERLGRAVAIQNDANCFALSEATDGAGAGFACVFGIILGTGVGGGIVMNGRILAGRNLVAGEWGHNALPWPAEADHPAPACYCGKAGCIETYLCGPALERQYATRAGEAAPARLIAERAAAGEPAAVAALDLYTDRLARALAGVVNILDPDVFVFGGGLSNIDAIIAGVRAKLPAWVFSDHYGGEFRRNRWGDSSGVRGAAWLAGQG